MHKAPVTVLQKCHGVAKMSRVLQTMQKFEMPLHTVGNFLLCAGDSYILFTLSYFSLKVLDGIQVPLQYWRYTENRKS